jgi:predicted glycoside hydrolase/deacetylase ChbG (UPF0249 family)
MLIINADDFGRTIEETDVALQCFKQGRITSATAMMFMADSERAARLANEVGLPVGLHLNLSQNYTGELPAPSPATAHRRVVRFLSASKYCIFIYHPFLRSAFRQVFESQIQEFVRLFGKAPSHIDGHQHRHLCLNMVLDRVIPKGYRVRRNFTYLEREKGVINRSYRKAIDSRLAKDYFLTDYFFSLSDSLKRNLLKKISHLANSTNVELMTHPVNVHEGEWLLSGLFNLFTKDLSLGSFQGVK